MVSLVEGDERRILSILAMDYDHWTDQTVRWLGQQAKRNLLLDAGWKELIELALAKYTLWCLAELRNLAA